MAKLPAASMKNLERCAARFRSFSKIKDFRFEDFEDKAEALEKQNPGQGYRLAYQETLTDLFRKIFNKHLQGEENLPTLGKFVQYYDTILMKTYLDERKAQNMGVDIRIHTGGPSLETLEAFRQILDEHPASSVVDKVNQRFASGELTLDNTYDRVKAKAKGTPTRAEARELVACAAFLENRNKERSVWNMLLNLRTHFKERSAVKAMRALAGKCGKIKALMHEAENESADLKKLRSDVADGILFEQDRRRPIFDEAAIKEINEGILDESMDLEGDALDFMADDDAAGKELFGDESTLEAVQTVERVEFNEEDIDIFPKDVEAKKVEPRAFVKDQQTLK